MGMTTIESSGPASVTIPAGTSAAQVIPAFDVDFRQRLEVIATLVAIAVLAEDAATADHASRENYARQLISDPGTVVGRSIVFAVVADGVSDATSADQDIANRLGDLWDVLSAGY
jgi:hypothetical protein